MKNNRDEFTEAELFMRERSELPPYGRLANITVNKNAVPNDPQSPFVTSGIRLGTPAVTTRGFSYNEVETLTNWICDIVLDLGNENKIDTIRDKVVEMCSRFPVYK